MEQECAVPGCLNKNGHSFPQNPQLRQIWMNELGLEDTLGSPDTAIVCQRHFISTDYDRDASSNDPGHNNALKPSSIPSTHLSNQGSAAAAPSKRQIAVMVMPKPTFGGRVAKRLKGDQMIIAAPPNSKCERCKHRVLRSLQCYVCKLYFHVKCAENSSAVMLGHGYVRCCDLNDRGKKKIFMKQKDGHRFVPVDKLNQLNSDTVTAARTPEETKVKVEHFNKDGSAKSLADEDLGMPVEQVIIKEELMIKDEPDESSDHSLDGSEDALSLPLGELENNDQTELFNASSKVQWMNNQSDIIKDSMCAASAPPPPPPKQNVCSSKTAVPKKKRHPDVVTPSTWTRSKTRQKMTSWIAGCKKTLRGKSNLADYSEEDLRNPRLAAKFYSLAKDLWRENLLMCARNEKLAEENLYLKKVLKWNGVVVNPTPSYRPSLRPTQPEQEQQVADNNNSGESAADCINEESFERDPIEFTVVNSEDEEQQAEPEAAPPISSTVAEAANATASLTVKSKKKYETAYKSFLDWQNEHETTSFSENVLMAYFDELETQKNFKATTLWSQYSMLRTLLVNNHCADISKYSRLRAYLKRRSDGYQSKTSNVLTANDINAFIAQAPDEDYLLTKVALIIGVLGACRRHELHRMTTGDLKDFGSTVLVHIPSTDTKVGRRFTITGRLHDIYKKYATLRPRNVHDTCFFLNYHKGRCNTQRVGINKLGNMPKDIATYLNLPRPAWYTGLCFRQSAASIFLDDDGNIACLKKPAAAAMADDCVEDPLLDDVSGSIEDLTSPPMSPVQKTENGPTSESTENCQKTKNRHRKIPKASTQQ